MKARPEAKTLALPFYLSFVERLKKEEKKENGIF